jgi:hypothetical protein
MVMIRAVFILLPPWLEKVQPVDSYGDGSAEASRTRTSRVSVVNTLCSFLNAAVEVVGSGPCRMWLELGKLVHEITNVISVTHPQ